MLYAGAFTIADPETLSALLKLGTWSPLLGVLGHPRDPGARLFAIIRYFMTTGREKRHPIKTFLAPVDRRLRADRGVLPAHQEPRDLSGAEDNWFIKLIPWFVLAIFLSGIVVALYWRNSNRPKYDAIGRFVHEDA